MTIKVKLKEHPCIFWTLLIKIRGKLSWQYSRSTNFDFAFAFSRKVFFINQENCNKIFTEEVWFWMKFKAKQDSNVLLDLSLHHNNTIFQYDNNFHVFM